MKSILFFILYIFIGVTSYSQYSINYASSTAGAKVGDGSSNPIYFGPSPYSGNGACLSSWQWGGALCSNPGTEDDILTSTKISSSGSTWSSGSGASRFMVIDLGVARTFNELRVFQMFSDGKVTSIQMYTHPDTTNLPNYSDVNWVSTFPEENISAGLLTGSSVTNPTVINFSHIQSRYLLIEAKNNGSLGNPSYTEIRELKLFNTNGFFLPIELVYFKLSAVEKNEVQIEWQTATEVNNAFFTIENSRDGIDWNQIEIIEGAGNSNSLLKYATSDSNPYNGLSYYRLKQTDFDGQYTYSDVKSVNIENTEERLIHVYINNSNNQVNISGSISELETVQVFNTIGKNVTNKTVFIENKRQNKVLDFSKLNSGIYFIRTKTTTKKIYHL